MPLPPKHPDDPSPLAILARTVLRDVRGRASLLRTFCQRHPDAQGYVACPVDGGDTLFFDVSDGRERSWQELWPRTASGAAPLLPVRLGIDHREPVAVAVAEASICETSPLAIVKPISLWTLQDKRLYTRPTDRRDGRLWDVLSDASMATDHAIARFFTPHLHDYRGWALSLDCDVLVRSNLQQLWDLRDDRYAVMVVQHDHSSGDVTKMDGQVQTYYARKNWSSVMLWNCGHPANRALSLDVLNRWPGRDLHGFRWLLDEEIGALPPEWNYLVGVNAPQEHASIVHFTLGLPSMAGYESSHFADEWRAYAVRLLEAERARLTP